MLGTPPGILESTGTAGGPQAPYAKKWSLPVKPDGQQGLSAPVISEDLGLVVALGKTSVLGAALADGAKRFTLARTAGPPSTPAIATVHGTDIVLFTEGSKADDSDLKAVDLKTQKPFWDQPVSLAAPSRSGVTVSDQTAYVCDMTGNVTAVDLATGKKLWTHSVAGSGPPLAVAGGHVILAVGGGIAQATAPTVAPDLVSLAAATGREEWHTTLGTAGVVPSIPSILGDRVVVQVSNTTGSVANAYALGDGSELWSSKFFPTPFFQLTSPASTGGDLAAVDAGGDVRRIDAASGDTQWDYALNQTPLRGPVLSGNAVLLGLSNGSIVAIDASSGLLVWQSAKGDGLVGPLAVAQDVFVAVRGGHSAGLVAYANDPGGALLAEHSPTEVRWAALVGWYLLAAAIVVVVLVLLARLALGRLGPAQFPGDEDENPQDDEDTEAGS